MPGGSTVVAPFILFLLKSEIMCMVPLLPCQMQKGWQWQWCCTKERKNRNILVRKRKWTGNCLFVCLVPYLASASHSFVLPVAMKLLPTPLLDLSIRCEYQTKLKFLGPLDCKAHCITYIVLLMLKGCSSILVAWNAILYPLSGPQQCALMAVSSWTPGIDNISNQNVVL